MQESSSSSGKANWVYLNPKISYGEIIDSRDDQVYKTVKIGSNTWMAENMNYAVSGSYCMKDSKDNCAKYGRLYTLEVAKTICPTGWKLPAISDWEDMYAAAKAVTIPADSAWAELWSASYYDLGTDKLGFSGVPTSVWDINRSSKGYIALEAAFFWSSTGTNTFELYPHSMYFGYYSPASRLAVRCIKE